LDFADFGRYLTQQRELRGMSRDDVQKVTKIPGTIISALETGQVDRLPARVFVLNYIKAYAGAIGIAPDEAVLRFEELDGTVKSAPPAAALERDRRKSALVRLVVLVVGLCAVGYALLALTGALPGGSFK
jgi:cytoskeletal protein RodZ